MSNYGKYKHKLKRVAAAAGGATLGYIAKDLRGAYLGGKLAWNHVGPYKPTRAKNVVGHGKRRAGTGKWYKQPAKQVAWVPPKKGSGSIPPKLYKHYPSVGTDMRRSHRTHKKAKRSTYSKKKRTVNKRAVRKMKRKM